MNAELPTGVRFDPEEYPDITTSPDEKSTSKLVGYVLPTFPLSPTNLGK